MANALYDKYREGCLTNTGPSFSTQNIKVGFLSTKYTFSASHQFLSSVLSTQMVKRSTTNLTGKTITSGVANASNITVPAVNGVTVKAVAIWRDTGSSATSELMVYIDTPTSGLPFTPSGASVVIAWSTQANKIFKL